MGQKLACFDATGKIIAFYDTEDSPPPAGASVIDLTDSQWLACLEKPGWTVVGGVLTPPVPPTAAELLAQAQVAQIATLKQSYGAAIQQPVSYTSKGGVTKTYQADPQSVANLQNMLLAFQAAGAAPTGFYWVSLDNTQVPFTYADLQGLAAVMGEQGAAAFQHLQTLKAEVTAAASVSAVQAITW